MGSLISVMQLASSALSADQSALSATASNISNQNTVGYTRRVVNWSEGASVSVGSSLTGVVATVSAQQRDRVLQRTVQQATDAAGASGARVTALNNLQSLFTIDSSGDDASGIGEAISGFFNAASTLAASPSNSTAQQSMMSAAQKLAGVFQRAALQITTQTASLNSEVSDDVQQANSLATRVASLNKQITENPAGDSRDALIDERDTLVSQVSQLVGVNSITSADDVVNLALPDGTPLVSGASALPLVMATVSGLVRVYAAGAAGGADVTSAIQGGSAGGTLQARDADLADVSKQLDTIASAIATAVNAQNALGLTPAGATGGAIFSGNTAASLQVVATSGADFASTSATGTASSNALAISNLQSSGIVGGNTPSGAFAALVAGLGTRASSASTISKADAAVLTQAQTQWNDTSGVSLDEEAANLTQFQRSYEAAAKVLSIVDTLLAQAINLGQQTTVS